MRGHRGSRDSEAREGTEGAALRFRMSRNVSDAHREVKAAPGKADDRRRSEEIAQKQTPSVSVSLFPTRHDAPC